MATQRKTRKGVSAKVERPPVPIKAKVNSKHAGTRERIRKIVKKSSVKSFHTGAKTGALAGALGGMALGLAYNRRSRNKQEESLQQTVEYKLMERRLLESPAAVKAWATKAGIPVKEAERRWKEAEKAAKEQGHSPEEGSDFYRYTMGIYKTMMYKKPGQNAGGRGTKALQQAADESFMHEAKGEVFKTINGMYV